MVVVNPYTYIPELVLFQIPAEHHQTMAQPDILTTHPLHLTDSFTLYFKSTILLSKVRSVLTAYRRSLRPDDVDSSNFRLRPEFVTVSDLALKMREHFPRHLGDPTAGTIFNQVDVMLYAAHAISLLCVYGFQYMRSD